MDPKKTSRILIVDDNPKNLEILGKTLENQSYEVEFATSGKGALEWMDHGKFDLMLLDVNMPGLDGFEVCRIVRSNPDFEDIPVIFLTAEVDKASIVEGFNLGAQDYVTKPFDTRELLARVDTHIELRQNRQKLKSVNDWLEAQVRERTEQLRRANEALLELDSAKAEFLNIISHEIRTPLNGIIGPVQLIKETTETEKLSVLIDILDQSVSRLEKFSIAALTITNLRVGDHPVRKHHTLIEKIIETAISELAEKIKSRELRIDRRFDSPGLEISCDQDLVTLSLVNILSNAVKFSEKGGDILIRTGYDGDDIFCSISDRGPGFSDEAMNKLFTLFATGKSHVNMNYGLDLALVKMIMDAHEGRIEVTNNSDAGATVRLVFKASQD